MLSSLRRPFYQSRAMCSSHSQPTGEYRQYLPDLNLPRFQAMRNQDAHEYADDFKTKRMPPWLHALYMHWLDLLQEPFKGVTTDGRFSLNLFSYIVH